MNDRVAAAHAALSEHTKRFPGQILDNTTWAGVEFDRLYLDWIRARWDAGDKWVHDVWGPRP